MEPLLARAAIAPLPSRASRERPPPPDLLERLYDRLVAHPYEQIVAWLRARFAAAGSDLPDLHAVALVLIEPMSAYPPGVAEVIAVEPEPYLRRRLTESAELAPVAVTVIDATAEQLPFEDGRFDAAVSCLVLCSVADPVRALSELRRVLRPGAELRFLEHVASATPGRCRMQRAADATLWPWLSGGCHLGRDTTRLIGDAGFAIEQHERFAFGIPPLDPPKTHVVGMARTPGA